jgi:hypothetical protein
VASIICSKCSKQIYPDNGAHLPPWCPRCGTDLKPGLDLPGLPPSPPPLSPFEGERRRGEGAGPSAFIETPPPAPTNAAPTTTPQPDGATPMPAAAWESGRAPWQPPYFAVKPIRGFPNNIPYRVYVLPEELLFLDSESNQDKEYQGLAFMMAGAVGGAIAKGIIDAHNKPRTEALRRALDDADTEELRQTARDGGSHFWVETENVAEAVVAPVGIWDGLFHGTELPGVLTLKRIHGRKLKCAVTSYGGLRVAMQELPKVLRERVAVKIGRG